MDFWSLRKGRITSHAQILVKILSLFVDLPCHHWAVCWSAFSGDTTRPALPTLCGGCGMGQPLPCHPYNQTWLWAPCPQGNSCSLAAPYKNLCESVPAMDWFLLVKCWVLLKNIHCKDHSPSGLKQKEAGWCAVFCKHSALAWIC